MCVCLWWGVCIWVGGCVCGVVYAYGWVVVCVGYVSV